MTYAGLTTADKGALLDAKARGFKTVKPFHQSANEWDVDLALAQIAEMESKQKELLSEKASEKGCLTWNERINWMTVEEKAWYFVYYHEQSNYEENRLGEVIEVATIGYKTSLAPEQYFYDEADAIAATVKILRSPYTEGETK